MEIENLELLAAALDRASIERTVVHLSKPEQIVGYYQNEYDGKWQRELAKSIQPYTQGKNGQPMKVENIMRRFQPTRLEKTMSTRKNAEQFKKVGEKLPGTVVEKPKKIGGKRARVTTTIMIAISKEKKPRKRNINEVLTPHQASQLRHGDLEGLIEAYGGINPAEIMSLEFKSPTTVEYLG